MNRLELNPNHLAHHEDWEDDHAAFTCPLCEKVFIVSGAVHGGERKCPNCGKSTGHVSGPRGNEGRAWLEW